MAARQSERIKLWGIVQGVGFRPYVAKAAEHLGMKGQVLNIGGLVEITVTDTPARISAFIEYILENKPAPAEIVHVKREPVDFCNFDSFTIIKSSEGDDEAAMIPADLAICPDCLRELYDDKNRRFQHPFISCMVCGPRYTIIDRIPYDRENTSMVDFPMCDFCNGQYTDIADRRYHAQTISCHDCGPQLIWKAGPFTQEDSAALPATSPSGSKTGTGSTGRSMASASDDIILDHAASLLKNGGVIAFKSVGGYNLVADPFNDQAVSSLRTIKKRETKPFAVMFRDVEQIERYCFVSDAEKKLLASSARPIILLEHKETDSDEINRSRFIGSFLPSFAAQYMLLDRISPLIFTSANLSDMPMIKDEDDMQEMMRHEPLIDGMIYNTRKIRVHADDSVARVIDGQPQLIRRSKGYAPVPLYVDITSADTDSDIAGGNADVSESGSKGHHREKVSMIFATGGQLKNSFALTKGPFVYMSQFFGDMDTVENQSLYEENVSRLSALFRIRPEAVVCDMHPLYFTTSFAEKYASENDLPLIRVQHHHAHVASVMAENDIRGKIIGVSFDGTGYGTDGCIWGGEFFVCEDGECRRAAHLRYVDMIGGDSSVKDARRSALSYIHAYDNGYLCNSGRTDGDTSHAASEPRSCLQPADTFLSGSASTSYCRTDGCRQVSADISDIIEYGRERLLASPGSPLITSALKAGINTVKSSSMGRLFDGVSSLLGIKDFNDYEGQCAIMLEDAAAFAARRPGESDVCDLALSFHRRISDMILDQCIMIRDEYDTSQVALTGGTFQNKILMEDTLEKLRAHGFTPYYNISVSPNDGGIALGQSYVAMHRLK